MKAINGLKAHYVDSRTTDISELTKTVIDLDRQSRMMEETLGTQCAQMNEKLALIDDTARKNQRRFISVEEDIRLIRTETARTNLRLETIETEIKNVHKEFSQKSDLIIGKFNQIIELLRRSTP
jgi:hypothetical protein